jgi:hypothetical protein
VAACNLEAATQVIEAVGFASRQGADETVSFGDDTMLGMSAQLGRAGAAARARRSHSRVDPSPPREPYGDEAMTLDRAPELPSRASAPEQPNRRYICNRSNLHSSVGALVSAKRRADAPPPWYALI